ncbi:hypothetical protein HY636_06145 [Candidatus Woesearchaeota archaeon]|nr:hypothetical protein [Candidatus Woesearchaeota archaeon]
MKIRNFELTKKHILFILIFAALVFIGSRINFSPLVGANNQFFTLFQFFGPIAGAFLGPIFGAVSVLGSEIADYLIAGKAFTLINVIRLTPMLFAAYYFGRKYNITSKIAAIVVPLIAIFAFVMHPVGRTVWFFSLYWTIPIIIVLLPEKYSHHFSLKSLGATFTAHSVGGAAWIWAIPMTAEQWIALIPVVAFERTLFALGIAGSYLIMNTVLDKAMDKLKDKFKWTIPADVLHINKAYVITKKMFRVHA